MAKSGCCPDDPLSAKTSLFVARTEEAYHDALAIIERATAATPEQRADLERLADQGRLDEQHLDDQTLEVFRLRLDRGEITRREASDVLMQVLTLNEFSPPAYVEKIKSEFARYVENGKATAINTPFLEDYKNRPGVLVDTVPANIAIKAVMAAAANSTERQRLRLGLGAQMGILPAALDVSEISEKAAMRLLDTLATVSPTPPLYAVPRMDDELRNFEELLQRRIEQMPSHDGSLTRADPPTRGIVAGMALFAKGNYFTIVDEDVQLYRFDRRDVEFADGPIDDVEFNRATWVTIALEPGKTRAFLPASDTIDAAIAETKARLLCEQTGSPFVLRGHPPGTMSGHYIASHGNAVAFHGSDGIYIGNRADAMIATQAGGDLTYSARSASTASPKRLDRPSNVRSARGR